jgi:hypothetical protein
MIPRRYNFVRVIPPTDIWVPRDIEVPTTNEIATAKIRADNNRKQVQGVTEAQIQNGALKVPSHLARV